MVESLNTAQKEEKRDQSDSPKANIQVEFSENQTELQKPNIILTNDELPVPTKLVEKSQTLSHSNKLNTSTDNSNAL